MHRKFHDIPKAPTQPKRLPQTANDSTSCSAMSVCTVTTSKANCCGHATLHPEKPSWTMGPQPRPSCMTVRALWFMTILKNHGLHPSMQKPEKSFGSRTAMKPIPGQLPWSGKMNNALKLLYLGRNSIAATHSPETCSGNLMDRCQILSFHHR